MDFQTLKNAYTENYKLLRAARRIEDKTKSTENDLIAFHQAVLKCQENYKTDAETMVFAMEIFDTMRKHVNYLRLLDTTETEVEDQVYHDVFEFFKKYHESNPVTDVEWETFLDEAEKITLKYEKSLSRDLALGLTCAITKCFDVEVV